MLSDTTYWYRTAMSLQSRLGATLLRAESAEAELAALKGRRCESCRWFDAWPEGGSGLCLQVHTKHAPMRVFSPSQSVICDAAFGGCAAHEPRESVPDA
jgi:hypothetical protein